MRHALCGSLAAFLLGASAFGTGEAPLQEEGFTVAPNGDDDNPGTGDLPWKTLSKAARSVKPGDTVNIRAGTYSGDGRLVFQRAGTADRPITYKAAGDGEVIVSNAIAIPGPWKLVQGKVYSTTLAGNSDLVFRNGYPLSGLFKMNSGDRRRLKSIGEMTRNTHFKSGNTLYVWLEDDSDPNQAEMRASQGHVIQLSNCHYSVFEGLTVEYGYNGFKTQGADTHHITIRRCRIRSILDQGVQPIPSDTLIEHSLFQKIGSSKYTHEMYGSKPGLIVRHNVFEEISGAAIHQYNSSGRVAGGCDINGNLFRKPRRMAWEADAARPYYVEMIVYGEGKCRITNNLFVGDGKRGGISLNSPDNTVSNNTFFETTVAVGIHSGQNGTRIFNNIVSGAAREFMRLPPGVTGQEADHNLYFRAAGAPVWQWNGASYPSFPDYQKASGEAHSVYGDPLFAGPGDFHLRAGSPARRAGAPRAGAPTDFDGVARPPGSAVDLGAFQYATKSTER